jgi:hypothetical protein
MGVNPTYKSQRAPPTSRRFSMDWDMLLAFTGLYILTIGMFYHHWRHTRQVAEALGKE